MPRILDARKAIDKADGPWILIVDADERISEGLSKELKAFLNRDESAVFIPRKNIIFNKWIKNTGWWPDYQLRFFKKGAVLWNEKIHSIPSSKGKEYYISPKEENAIEHYNYQSISQFLQRLDRYTTIEAEQRDEKFSWDKLISEPVDEFVKRFFAEKGYSDGIHGLALSLLMSFYALITELKVWEKKKFEDQTEENFLGNVSNEISKSNKKIMWWEMSEKILRTKNPIKKHTLRILRKKNSL